MVDQSTTNSKMKGSNPSTNTVRENFFKRPFFYKKANTYSTVEEHLTHNPEIEGSDPADCNKSELLTCGVRKW